MKSKQTMFFAVKQDFEQILKSIEDTNNIHYFKMGLMNINFPPNYNSILNTPDFGFTSFGDWNMIDSYLVMKAGVSLDVRKVPQRAGGVKYAVDQLANKKSIEFKPGGIYKNMDNILVAGRIATASDNETSNQLYKLFASKIKKEFRKIDVFYVGSHAEEKLKAGWRLVTIDGSPKEYDLSIGS